MGATVIVNFRTVVHKSSTGIATSVPDVCKTPAPPAPPVPIPYPNIAKSSDTDKGSKKVKMDGKLIMLKNSKFSRSMGDEAGTLKGIVSSTNMGVAKFALYSFDVKVEGKNVPRLGDMMLTNGNGPNTLAAALAQPNLVVVEVALQEIAQECEDQVENDPNFKNKDCKTKGTEKHDCCDKKVEEANDKSHKNGQPQCAYSDGAFNKNTGAPISRNNPRSGGQPPRVPRKRDAIKNQAIGFAVSLGQKAFSMIGSFLSGKKFPDVVISMDPSAEVGRGNCKAVYDFKFPCPKNKKPGWGENGKQGKTYNRMLKPQQFPKIISPTHII